MAARAGLSTGRVLSLRRRRLGGRQPAEMTLTVLMRPFAVTWTEQRKTLIG